MCSPSLLSILSIFSLFLSLLSIISGSFFLFLYRLTLPVSPRVLITRSRIALRQQLRHMFLTALPLSPHSTQHLDRDGTDRYTAEGHGSGRGLCARTVRNVYGVYKPCLLFVQHAERLLPVKAGGQSGLQLFLDSFVRNRFMAYLQVRQQRGCARG